MDFLINSKKAIKFFTAKGYKILKLLDFHIYIILFKKFIKKNTKRLINEELKINLKDYKNIETILVNKFWGRWSSKKFSMVLQKIRPVT